MNSNLSNLIDELKKSKENANKVILFCGAGISMASGLPSAKAIKKVVKDKKYLDDFNLSPNKKVIFWRSLIAHYSYNENHYSALSIVDQNCVDTIITSNYDTLFEQCISAKFPDWEETGSEFGIMKCYNGKQLINIHGDIFQENVQGIDTLTLAVAKETPEGLEVWKKTFKEKALKTLWVIGYSGKQEDAAYKCIKNSLKDNSIEQVYWMHLEGDEIDRILLEHKDKVHFIKIDGANQIFNEIKKKIPFPSDNEKYRIQTEKEDLERVRESFKIADVTIGLLSELDKGIVDTIEKAEQAFDNLLEPGESLNKRSELIVLRRFNSYTPVLVKKSNSNEDPDDKKELSKGGGYFLVCKGYGIVIDPGYDFIENYINHEYEPGKTLSLNHIDAVIITHAHNDHYGELDSLQNLIYQFNSRLRIRRRLIPLIERTLAIYNKFGFENEKKQLSGLIKSVIEDRPLFKPGRYAIESLNKGLDTPKENIVFLEKQISESAKGLLNSKRLKLFASRSAMKSIDGLLPIDKTCFSKINILNPEDKYMLTDKITLTATKAKHIDLYSKQHSVGLKFNLQINDKNLVIGFTGDTGYFHDLPKMFEDCDVLIPHLGSIKPKELDIYKGSLDEKELNINLQKGYLIPKLENSQKTAFYGNHLGIIGIATLLSSIKAKTGNNLEKVLISEYGEEISPYREAISKLLEKLITNPTTFVEIQTGDIGTTVELSSMGRESNLYTSNKENADG